MKPASALVRAADRFGRLALILALVWIGWTTVGTVRRLVAPVSPPGRPPAPARDALPDLAELAEADLSQGSWVFAGGRWTSRLDRVSDDDLRARLNALADLQPPPDDDLATDARNPFAAFAKLPVHRTVRGSRTLHDLDANGCRVRLVTTSRLGRDAPVAAILAFRGEPGQWLLIEMRPTAAAAPLETEDEPSLPVEAVAVCRWRGLDDRGLRLYRLDPPRPAADLAAAFRAQGWTVSLSTADPFQAVARRGDHSLFAWSPDSEVVATLALLEFPPL